MASTSTAAPNGNELALIAARACYPESPKTFDKVSEAGFITFG